MFRAIFTLFFITFVGAALLTPPLYLWLRDTWTEFPWLYSRVFDRVAMLLAFATLFLMRKEFNLKEVRELLAERSSALSLLVYGLTLSSLCSLAVVPILVDGDGVYLKEGLSDFGLTMKLLRTVPAALLISLIEEGFFRVLLFSHLKQRFNVWLAAIISSFLYAVCHFIKPVKTFHVEQYSITVGFEYLGSMLGRFLDAAILPALLGLFLVGLVLCCTIQRSSALYLCIGLHAGWVLAVKLIGNSILLRPSIYIPEVVGRENFLVSQPIGWISILGVLGLVYLGQAVLPARFKKHDRHRIAQV